MFLPDNKPTRQAGFSFIEMILGTAILGTVVVMIWGAMTISATRIAIARVRTMAANLANEKIEIIQNLDWDNIGTVTGLVSGPLPSTELIVREGITFQVVTRIRFEDSLADGSEGGAIEGNKIYYDWDGDWEPKDGVMITMIFDKDEDGFGNADDVTHTLDWDDYLSGNHFNWSGSVTVGDTSQSLHFHTYDDKVEGVWELRIQTYNLTKPAMIYVQSDGEEPPGTLVSTYGGDGTFAPGGGVEAEGGDETIPIDLYPSDYKTVYVEVTWDKIPCPSPIAYTTWIAKRSDETEEGKGHIQIRVIDSEGISVPKADISVNIPSESRTIVDQADLSGQIIILSLNPIVQGYQVSVTKGTDYTTDMSYAIGGAAGSNPLQTHLTVTEGNMTETVFVIDEQSSMVIQVLDSDGATKVANVPVDVTGSRIIGLGDPDAEPFPIPDVLLYDTTGFTTDASGEISIDPMAWDTYTIEVEYGDVTPHNNQTRVIQLAAGVDELVTFTPNILEFIVLDDDAPNDPVNGAQVALVSNPVGSYDESMLTDVDGKVYFKSLLPGNYSYTVTADGYPPVGVTPIVVAGGDLPVTIYLIDP